MHRRIFKALFSFNLLIIFLSLGTVLWFVREYREMKDLKAEEAFVYAQTQSELVTEMAFL